MRKKKKNQLLDFRVTHFRSLLYRFLISFYAGAVFILLPFCTTPGCTMGGLTELYVCITGP